MLIGTMFHPGLVSVTFRKLSPEEIVEHCVKARLLCLEWGGDIHVPHGDTTRAREVGELTRNAGLRVAAYGSYYRLANASGGPDWSAVRDAALALGAPLVRVWAGTKASDEMTETDWQECIDDAGRIAEDAAAHDLQIAWEYHANTLTDSVASTRRLLDVVDAPHVSTLWQPSSCYSEEERVLSLRDVLPRVSNVHVYHWVDQQRLPLSEGREVWTNYLEILRTTGREHDLMLEFVPDNDPSLLAREACSLRFLLGLEG